MNAIVRVPVIAFVTEEFVVVSWLRPLWHQVNVSVPPLVTILVEYAGRSQSSMTIITIPEKGAIEEPFAVERQFILPLFIGTVLAFESNAQSLPSTMRQTI